MPGGSPGGGPPGGGPPGGRPPGNYQPPYWLPVNQFSTNVRFKFEKKMKLTDIPEWDGNGDTILDWLDKLNHTVYHIKTRTSIMIWV